MRKTGVLDAVLHLYPPWWRARYEDEVRAIASDVIAAGRSPWQVWGNLFTGAVRLRATGAPAPRQFAHWAGRTRASIAVATLPVVVAVPVVLSFLQGRRQSSPGQTTTPPFHVVPLGGAGRAVDLGALVMLLALFLAVSTIMWGYVDLAGAVRKRGRNDRRLRFLVRVPGIAAVMVVALWVLAVVARPRLLVMSHGVSRGVGGHPALAYGLDVGAGASLGVGLAAAFVMVVLVARRADLSLPDLSSGQWVGFTTSALLWVMAGAAVTTVVGLARQGSGNYGVVTTSWGSWWIGGVAILVLAAVVSTGGAVRARRSLRVAAQLRD